MIILLWTICIVLSLLVLAMIVSINIYNRIASRLAAVEQAWRDVIMQEKLKNEILPQLEKAIEHNKLCESSLTKKINDLKVSLMRLEINKIDLTKLADTEKKMSSLHNHLKAIVNGSPELKTSDLFVNVMQKFADHEKNVSKAIEIFNAQIEHFNNGLTIFPDSIVNKNFNKQSKLKTFKDALAEYNGHYLS